MELRATVEIDGEKYTIVTEEDEIKKKLGCYELLDTEGQNEFMQHFFNLTVANRWGVGAPKLN